jgi:hypothetical protein
MTPAPQITSDVFQQLYLNAAVNCMFYSSP